jgi:hypothetical protein
MVPPWVEIVQRLPCRLLDRLDIERAHEHQGGHPDLREVKRGGVELALLDVVPAGRHLEDSPLHLANEVLQCGVLDLDERAQVRRELSDE